jgi:hypothetical protein
VGERREKNSKFYLSIFLLEEGIINKCDGCGLNYICDKLDEFREKYLKETTEII